MSHAEEAAAAPALETATFGGGCFWCTEAVYVRLAGVTTVEPGYSGGDVEDPTYEEVCAKGTGHAEVIQIRFDPAVVSFATVLEVFFQTHDPTTRNRQGNDAGPQYRSVILYHDAAQQQTAEDVIRALDASGAYDDSIVTEVVPFERFYPAEQYHHDYYAQNPDQGYCAAVVRPKVEKFEKVFKDRLKRP